MTSTAYGDDGYKREIARIESTMLGWEDHGILTAMLQVSYGGSGQSIGGYPIGPRCGAAAAYWIEWTLKACGVSKWEDVRGRTIFVLSKDGRVEGIEPLPTERGERFVFADGMASTS